MIELAGEQTDVEILGRRRCVSITPADRGATLTVGTVGCCGGGSSGASPLPALIGSSDLPAQPMRNSAMSAARIVFADGLDKGRAMQRFIQ